ncbi:similar to Saccharomyces cerevisiae YGR004W PEX31 Peroxisomal integral membrane protein, involved in negative regulation of peroxisome size [Maudiozyma saulgeensis]|uniref:Similar to Saccharomyces cerevisiae YGR004W PEX31 Peroxisomal integral membrane protein, involved in negative regulation of peroxisome size n=1 Tax=Maudiozyma saulgeensis TaxID=1789683 RepID=A0A1X7R9V2_9SACH|nr:similar to Saccharomyces cerevisiae YGR004W PEX31 Peroxisomal integral membrane protein, involved in negative regulation of peroxisome size [Kazachstania saulgeensis]
MSTPEKSKTNVTRAEFVNKRQGRIGGKTEEEFLEGLRSSKSSDGDKNGTNSPISNEYLGSSPLLTSTPSTISKVLINLYPYLIIWDNLLGVLTWTCDDIWPSVLLVLTYFGAVLYLDTIVKYFGHIVIISIFIGYAKLDKYIGNIVTSKPTLENIVTIMSRISLKSDILLSPFSNLNIRNIQRILLTALLLSPIHILVSWLILPPRKLLLLNGLFVLTYHSSWSKVTRRLLWKFRFVRLLVFYITGIDLGGINKNNNKSLFAAVQNQVSKLSSAENSVKDGNNNNSSNHNKPIRFTYVLYENQRRWIGMGWNTKMLSYERTAWTDEFLNEAPEPENFELPNENSEMQWRWIDKTWRLDLTNDGAITMSDVQAKTTASPGSEDGYLYYDNQWKKPSVEESFSKYTRRRRWVRTAELIKITTNKDTTKSSNINDSTDNNTTTTTGIIKKVESSTSATETSIEVPITIKKIDSSNYDSKDYDSGSSTVIRNRMAGASSINTSLSETAKSTTTTTVSNGLTYIDD